MRGARGRNTTVARQAPLGDSAVFAFYPNKQITTGEGGMIVTGDEEAARLMRSLRNQGRSDGDNLAASIPTWAISYRLDEIICRAGRRPDAAPWRNCCKKEAGLPPGMQIVWLNIPYIQPPLQLAETTRQSWFVYVIRLLADVPHDQVVERLAARGIPARPYFRPIHLQSYMVERFGYQEGDFPITEDLGKPAWRCHLRA